MLEGRWSKIGLAVLFALLALGLGVHYLIDLAIEDHPELTEEVLTHREAMPIPLSIRERIKGGTLGRGQEKRFILNSDDLNVICRSALIHRKLPGQCTFKLTQDSLIGEVTLPLNGRFSGKFLNISLLAQGADAEQFHVADLRIGRIHASSNWHISLIRTALLVSPFRRYELFRSHLIRDIHVTDSRLVTVINWNRELLTELRGLVTDAADKRRMRVYLEELTRIIDDGTQNRYIRLGALTRPMFTLARERSRRNNEPIEENRAAIMVLSAYANGKDLHEVVGTSNPPPRRNVLLNKRIDTAKHFLAASVLAMSGQSTLVEMIGLAKELQDTHDGSGFSFIDLAADEAGALFGKAAISSNDRARHLQELLRQTDDESQFIPVLKDLPESMNPDKFSERFGSIGSPEYEALRSEIRNRIHALPIYH